mmetsp:Transcript_9884/g.27429  ORF Transcript_9884/g.27429 Transcript_9884/m.27429 type:complete len:126 (+) Transcript_9884:112-489(+)
MGNITSTSVSPATPLLSKTSSPLTFVNAVVASHQVVIFSKSWCPYCDQTKALFGNIHQARDVKIVELDGRPDGDDIQQALAVKTGQRTVPNVFVTGQHVGGNDDVHYAFRRGSLLQMLQQWSRQP